MKLHHINISCTNLESARRKFVSLFSFEERGWLLNKETNYVKYISNKTYVLVKGKTIVTLVGNDNISVDTVDDIVLCVDSVSQCCSNVTKYGGTVIEEPYFVDCSQRCYKGDEIESEYITPCKCGALPCENFIEKAVIKSSVGNIRHTLLNKRNYKGEFLPGFVSWNVKTNVANGISSVNSIDHIALAVRCGETSKHVKWYKNALSLTLFKTHTTESQSGLVIHHESGNGLRMLVLEVHPCSSTAVGLNDTCEIEMGNEQVKFVFVESLKDEGSDQVQIFLRHHGGPGVQHIALSSGNIINDAQHWLNQGVRFVKPPAEYYKEIESTLTKLENNCCLKDIIDVGILVDAETHRRVDGGKDGYLYQVFTEPVFDSHTFFFELIQRDNARGFGAGNVKALWRALDCRLQLLNTNI